MTWIVEVSQRVNETDYVVYVNDTDPFIARYVIQDRSREGDPKLRTFYGETAHHQAERAFMDDVLKVVHG